MNLSVARHDATGAMVGALAALPQAVAFGLIAFSPLGADWVALGIGAGVGTSILFGLITGAWGSNPFLVSGPGSVTAVVMATGIQTALLQGFEAEAALAIAFMSVVAAGAFQVLAGVFRLGHLVGYLPVPVLAGFVNASAILVLVGSIPMLLGVPDRSVMKILAGDAFPFGGWAITVSGMTLCAIFVLHGRIRLLPPALLGLILGAITYQLGVQFFAQAPGPVVGHIGFSDLFIGPQVLSQHLQTETLWDAVGIVLATGIPIGLLASFHTLLTAGALDAAGASRSDANRDLRVHGLANLAMGFLGFLPGSGTLTRSLAVMDAGAKTRAANVGAAVAFLLMLLLLAPVVATLPLWATSGMLAATAILSLDRETLRKLRDIACRTVPYPRLLLGDLLITLVVVVTALTFSLIVAVGVGVLLAVILFVLGLGRDPIRNAYTCRNIHSKIQRSPHQMEVLSKQGHRTAVIEIQGALFFGACAKLRSQVRRMTEAGAEFVILDFRYLNSIDSTGAALLRSLAVICTESGGRLILSSVEPERRLDPKTRRRQAKQSESAMSDENLRWVWLSLHANGVIPIIGEEWIFDDKDVALSTCEDLILKKLGHLGEPSKRGIIANSPIFSGLSRRQISELGRFSQRHRFSPGDIVFRQEEDGDRAYLIVTGRMDVLIDMAGSRRKRRVSALTEGTLFGEMGLMDGSRRSATVNAVQPSICLSINAESFQALQLAKPDIAMILLKNLSIQFADRLRRANTMISEL